MPLVTLLWNPMMRLMVLTISTMAEDMLVVWALTLMLQLMIVHHLVKPPATNSAALLNALQMPVVAEHMKCHAHANHHDTDTRYAHCTPFYSSVYPAQSDQTNQSLPSKVVVANHSLSSSSKVLVAIELQPAVVAVLQDKHAAGLLARTHLLPDCVAFEQPTTWLSSGSECYKELLLHQKETIDLENFFFLHPCSYNHNIPTTSLPPRSGMKSSPSQ